MARGTKYESEQDLLVAAGYLGTTVGIFAGPVVSAATWPAAAGLTLGLVVGAGISSAVWGEEGLQDFAQFYTGDGNYYSSDPHGSGYFNVVENVKTIIEGSEPTAAMTAKQHFIDQVTVNPAHRMASTWLRFF